MRQAKIIYNNSIYAGILSEDIPFEAYSIEYDPSYQGPPISLTMPLDQKKYTFDRFPPYFEGVLPEGMQLEGLLQITRLDRNDYFGQLLSVGNDLVGAFSVEAIKNDK
jgi:serine/threonine-protein kinase HipA